MTEVVLAHWLIISMAVMMIFIGVILILLVYRIDGLEAKIKVLSDIIVDMVFDKDCCKILTQGEKDDI